MSSDIIIEYHKLSYVLRGCTEACPTLPIGHELANRLVLRPYLAKLPVSIACPHVHALSHALTGVHRL